MFKALIPAIFQGGAINEFGGADLKDYVHPRILATGAALAMVLSVMHLAIDAVSRPAFASDAKDHWAIYHPDPKNIWNRVFCHLYERHTKTGTARCGYDELNAWPHTARLLEGPSHAKTLALLDEFAASRMQSLINDPLKRAVLQHDLWTVFEGTLAHPWNNDSRPAKYQLQKALVKGMQRLALSRRDIESLPNNYLSAVRARAFPAQYDPSNTDQPFLPPDLWEPEGPWILISSNTSDVPAPFHVKRFHTPSLFFVFLKLPAGRQATLDYLKRLNRVSDAAPYKVSALPRLPRGTMVALVRTMFVVSDKAYPYPTPITESIQIRVYREPRKVSRIPQGLGELDTIDQDFYMFKLDRKALFSGKPSSLIPISEEDVTFIVGTFRSEHRTVDSCLICHHDPGITSVQTYSRALFVGERLLRLGEGRRDHEEYLIRQWKTADFSWGYFSGLWHSQLKRNSR